MTALESQYAWDQDPLQGGKGVAQGVGDLDMKLISLIMAQQPFSCSLMF